MDQNLSEGGIFHFCLSHIPKALCNEKALFVLFVTGLLTIALASLVSALAGSSFSIMAIPIFLAMLLVSPAGTSIAGLLLMDQACGQTPRPLRKAISDGIPAFLRILGIMLLGVALMAAFAILVSLLLLICKLPVVGPVLYAVLLPVFLVLGGLLYFGITAGLSMASPAVWSGATVREALDMLWRIVSNRSSELLVNLLLLAALIGVIQFILVGIIFAGSTPVTISSAFILNINIPFGFSPLTSSNYAFAIIFGFMITLMLVLAALTSMTLMGLNLIYLRITKDLPPAKALVQTWPPTLHGSTDKKEPMFQPIPQAFQPTPQITATNTTDSSNGMPDILASFLAETGSEATVVDNAKTAQICPLCRASIQPGDRFCGECGGSLQG
ncbi:MAG: hypothetical protein FWD67_04510 [Betaproteobacteria bacterium]|nr:hypothetical protein [Betaproteobacteria bacterium]